MAKQISFSGQYPDYARFAKVFRRCYRWPDNVERRPVSVLAETISYFRDHRALTVEEFIPMLGAALQDNQKEMTFAEAADWDEAIKAFAKAAEKAL